MPLVPMKRKIKSLKSLKSLKSVNLAYSGSMESGTNGKSNDLTYTLFSRYQQEVNNYGYGQRKGTERPYISKAKPHYRGSRRLFKHRSAQAERTHGRRTLSVRFVGGEQKAYQAQAV